MCGCLHPHSEGFGRCRDEMGWSGKKSERVGEMFISIVLTMELFVGLSYADSDIYTNAKTYVGSCSITCGSSAEDIDLGLYWVSAKGLSGLGWYL